MLFAKIYIMSPGEFFGFIMICIGVAIYYGKKYLTANPDVKDAAKKAVARKIIETLLKK